jgi:hypothetical protein
MVARVPLFQSVVEVAPGLKHKDSGYKYEREHHDSDDGDGCL